MLFLFFTLLIGLNNTSASIPSVSLEQYEKNLKQWKKVEDTMGIKPLSFKNQDLFKEIANQKYSPTYQKINDAAFPFSFGAGICLILSKATADNNLSISWMECLRLSSIIFASSFLIIKLLAKLSQTTNSYELNNLATLAKKWDILKSDFPEELLPVFDKLLSEREEILSSGKSNQAIIEQYNAIYNQLVTLLHKKNYEFLTKQRNNRLAADNEKKWLELVASLSECINNQKISYENNILTIYPASSSKLAVNWVFGTIALFYYALFNYLARDINISVHKGGNFLLQIPLVIAILSFIKPIVAIMKNSNNEPYLILSEKGLQVNPFLPGCKTIIPWQDIEIVTMFNPPRLKDIVLYNNEDKCIISIDEDFLPEEATDIATCLEYYKNKALNHTNQES